MVSPVVSVDVAPDPVCMWRVMISGDVGRPPVRSEIPHRYPRGRSSRRMDPRALFAAYIQLSAHNYMPFEGECILFAKKCSWWVGEGAEPVEAAHGTRAFAGVWGCARACARIPGWALTLTLTLTLTLVCSRFLVPG